MRSRQGHKQVGVAISRTDFRGRFLLNGEHSTCINPFSVTQPGSETLLKTLSRSTLCAETLKSLLIQNWYWNLSI